MQCGDCEGGDCQGGEVFLLTNCTSNDEETFLQCIFKILKRLLQNYRKNLEEI